jgi:hypothetical protein
MDNGSKLTTIREFNHRQELPSQESDATIFNGALFDVTTLTGSILLPPYNFKYPISDYSPTEIPTLIREYGINAGRLNSPKTYSVGVLDIPSTNDQYVTLITRETNRAGFWCLVQRSIFLHKPLPFCTTDFIAPSLTSAANNTPAPSEIWYRRPADIGPPAAPAATHN